jgi:Glucodextranase, domain B/Beta-propeller repeat
MILGLLCFMVLAMSQSVAAQGLLWAKRAGGTGSGDAATGIAVDGLGNVFVTGIIQGSATFGLGEVNETTLTSAGGDDIFVALYGSNGSLQWAKRAGGTGLDRGVGIAVDGSGNSYVTGVFNGSATFGLGEVNETTLTSAGGDDIFVAQYDSSGTLQWAKRAGGSGTDRGVSIAVDGSGYASVTGWFNGSATFGQGQASQATLTAAGSDEIFIAQYDSSGMLQWARRAGGSGLDQGAGIAVDSAGNVYVTGFFNGSATFAPGQANQTTLTTAGDRDMFVAKYDFIGTLVWARRSGGTGADRGFSIAVDGSGNSYVTGLFNGTATFGPGQPNQTTLTSAGSDDIFVAQYDSNGALQWVKRAGGTGSDGGLGIAVDGSGNSYVTGFFSVSATFAPGQANQTTLTSAGARDIFMVKYDSAGLLQWAKQAGAGGTNYDQGLGLVVDGSGNVYGVGYFNGTATFGQGEANQTALTSAGGADIFVAKFAGTISSDTTGPALVITSHTDNQTTTSSPITLSGTASDGGFGDTGISSVTVNGISASGGTASGSGTANWSQSVTLSPGPNLITVVAKDASPNQNSTTTQITINFSPPPPVFDFSLSNSGNMSVTQGQSGQNTITATLVSSPTQNTAFSVSGLPQNTMGTFSQASCSPTCSTTLTIATLASTPVGNYTITVTATDGSVTRTTSFTLAVNALAVFDFSLSNSGNMSVTQGQSGQNTITATLVSSPTQNTAFSVSGLPQNTMGTFSQASCSPTCSTTLTIATLASTPVGNYTITVTATDGSVTRTTSFTLAVNALAVFDFSLSNSGNVSVTQGQSGQNTITATLVSSPTQNTAFSVSGLPQNTTGTFSQASCSPTCSTTLTIATLASTPVGNYTITVTAIGGSVTRTISFTLAVNNNNSNGLPGSLLWAKRAGGTSTGEAATGTAVDGLGNVFVTGIIQGSATFGLGEVNETTLTSAGGDDIFVALYGSNGSLQWAKRAGGTGLDRGVGIAVDGSGNSYVTGVFNGSATFGLGEVNETTLTSAGGDDIFVAQYDSSGTLQWAKRAGGSGTDRGVSIAVDGSGYASVTGWFNGSATFGQGQASQATLTAAGSDEIFIAQYDSSGMLQWARRAGGSGLDQGAGIAVDSAGNVYVTGFFNGSATFAPGQANQTTLTTAGDRDLFVAKYDFIGTLVWARRSGGTGADRGFSIAVDGSGNSYVTGLFNGTATFGPGQPNQTTLSSAGLDDIFVARYDSNGTLQWVKRAGGTGSDGGLGIMVDGSGNSYLTGFFNGITHPGTATFGLGEPNQTTLTSAGDRDIFVVKYDFNGMLQWATRAGAGGPSTDQGMAIAVDGSGAVYAIGYFGDNAVGASATFGQGETNETTLTSAGGTDIFLAKYAGN